MPSNHMRAELRPEDVTAVIDPREQLPLDLAPLQSASATLTTGDYSVRGLENLVALERKSLPDLLNCCGNERERFEREVMRLLAYPCRALLIESNWREIEAGNYRSKIKPNAVIGSLLGWAAQGLTILMCDDHQRCGQYAARILYTAARRRWQEARQLIAAVQDKESAT
jgi:ERCC4-type nuclease